jgi:hypothetical protein
MQLPLEGRQRRRDADDEIATLVQSAKLNGVEPLAWLTDVIERIVSGRTRQHEVETLLPWNWQAAKEAEATKTG